MAENVQGPEVEATLNLGTEGFEKGLNRAKSLWGIFGDILDQQAARLNALGNTAIAVGGTIAVGMGPGVIGAAKLEEALARTFSVGELTNEEMADLKRTVLDLGASAIGPIDLADALYNLASAGLEVDEQMETLPVTMQLAVASAIQLNEASQLLVQSMRAFGLEATDAARIANVVAASNASSSSNALRLAQAYEQVGPIAGAMKLSIEETTAALNVLNDVFQNGEKAGTGLRGVLTVLASQAPKLEEAIEGTELSISDLDPTVVGVTEAVRNLNTVIEGGASEWQLFDREVASSASALTENVDRLAEYEERITGTNDVQKQFELQMKAASNRLKQLKNSIIATGISYSEGLLPFVKLATGAMQVFVEILDAVPGPLKRLIGMATAFNVAFALMSGVMLKFSAYLINTATGQRILNGLIEVSTGLAVKVGSVWGEFAVKLEAYRAAQIAATEAMRTGNAAGLIAARAQRKSAAASLKAFLQLRGGTLLATGGYQALRGAVTAVNAAFMRHLRILWLIATHPLVIWLTALGLLLREAAKHADVLRPAMKNLAASFGPLGEVVNALGPVFGAFGRVLSTIVLNAVYSTAAAVNALTWAMQRGFAAAQTFVRLLNPNNWGRPGEVMEEYADNIDDINGRFWETHDAMNEAYGDQWNEMWGDATDAMDELRRSMEMTEEEFIAAQNALSEFMGNVDAAATDIVFDVNATFVEQQLRGIDNSVKAQIEELDEFARKYPIIMRVDVDGQPLEEGVQSAFAYALEQIEAAGETARRMILDDFIGDLQVELDTELVDVMDEGTAKILAQYELRERELSRQRREAIQSAAGDAKAMRQVQETYAGLRAASRKRLHDELAEWDDRIVDTVRQAEERLARARIEAMDDGSDKIRASTALRVATIRRSAEEQREIVEEGTEEYIRLLQIEEQLVAAAYARQEREIAEHNREVQENLERSLAGFQDTIAQMQAETAKLTADNTGDPYYQLLQRQRSEMAKAQAEVRDSLTQIRDDLTEGIISTAEAQARGNAITREWAEQEAAIYEGQLAEQKTLLVEREADLLEHQQTLQELYNEANNLRADRSPLEEIKAQRNQELAALEAQYERDVLLAEGNADELLRIEQRYQAQRAIIIAQARSDEAQAHEEALTARVDREVEFARRVLQDGVAGMVNVGDLNTSIDRLKALREELIALGASGEAIAAIGVAIGDTNEAIVDLAEEGRGEVTSLLESIGSEVQQLTEEMFYTDGARARANLDRQLAAYDTELAGLKRSLLLKLGATDEYHEAVAQLEERSQERERLLREQARRAAIKDEEERAEAVLSMREDVEDEIARGRADAIDDEAERREALFGLDQERRRRSFERQLDEREATYEERLELMRGFHARERLLEREHQEEITAIERDEFLDRLDEFESLEDRAQKQRERQAQAAARSYITDAEGEIEARKKQRKAQLDSISATEAEIEALQERNDALIESMTGLSDMRSYYEQVRDLFKTDAMVIFDDPGRDRLQLLERERDTLEQLYKEAVEANVPFETRKALLQDLADLNEEVVELGGKALRGDFGIVQAASDEYRQQIEDAKTAADEYESNQAVIAKLGDEMTGFKDVVIRLDETLQSLADTLANLKSETEGEVWDVDSQRFIDDAEAIELARDAYVDALADMAAAEVPDLGDLRAEDLAERMLSMLEQGNLTEALRRYFYATGQAMPDGIIEGLLAGSIPGDPTKTLAEKLGIDDPEAWIEQFKETWGIGLSEGTEDVPEGAQRNAAEALGEAIEAAGDDTEEAAGGLGARAGQGLMEAFAQGVRDNADVLIAAIQGVLGDVREYLPSSDAKRGPLSDLTHSGQMFTRTWLAGAQKEGGRLSAGMSKLLGGATGAMPSSSRAIPGGFGGGMGPISLSVDGRDQSYAPGALALNARSLVREAKREIRYQRARG